MDHLRALLKLLNLLGIAVAQYYEMIQDQVHTLTGIINERTSEPMSINELIYSFAFDNMGQFGFGLDFGMMKSGEPIDGYLWMRSALGLLGPFSPAIWIARLGFAFIPGLWKVGHWFQMLAFSDMCMSECMKVKPTSKV